MDTATQTTPGLVQMRKVNKYFGSHHVLRDIDLDIARGEVIVVVGPSGSGKSTLCRTMNGLERIDDGAIRVDGQPMPQEGKALAKLRSEVGMVFQQFNLFPNKSVLDNVTFAPIKVRGRPTRQARAKAMDLLERFGVANQADKFPAQLSGGQQQRVAIARALIMEPKLMLFDEATSALDPEMVRGVLEIMQQLARDGMTMVVVTHEMGYAKASADRVVFMDHGQIIETAPPQAFFGNPQSERARKFLSEVLRD